MDDTTTSVSRRGRVPGRAFENGARRRGGDARDFDGSSVDTHDVLPVAVFS